MNRLIGGFGGGSIPYPLRWTLAVLLGSLKDCLEVRNAVATVYVLATKKYSTGIDHKMNKISARATLEILYPSLKNVSDEMLLKAWNAETPNGVIFRSMANQTTMTGVDIAAIMKNLEIFRLTVGTSSPNIARSQLWQLVDHKYGTRRVCSNLSDSLKDKIYLNILVAAPIQVVNEFREMRGLKKIVLEQLNKIRSRITEEWSGTLQELLVEFESII